MKRVFVDTSALLSLLDASDRDHARVSQALDDLSRQPVGLVTSSYVLVEAGALVKRRLGVEAFRTLGDTISRAMTVIWVGADLHAEAWSRAAQESRRGPSLVDWVGFLAMRELKIHTALALDTHFAEQGFEVLPADG